MVADRQAATAATSPIREIPEIALCPYKRRPICRFKTAQENPNHYESSSLEGRRRHSVDRRARTQNSRTHRRHRAPDRVGDLRHRFALHQGHHARYGARHDSGPRRRRHRRRNRRRRAQFAGRRPRGDSLDHRVRRLFLLSRGLLRAVRQSQSQRPVGGHGVFSAARNRPAPSTVCRPKKRAFPTPTSAWSNCPTKFRTIRRL